ncbi:Fc.00g056390.m01.CDS01 [Cosmosporella sp. VM-42]
MATLEKCLDCFPVLDTLMSYLSATDSAILLAVTGLLSGPSKSSYTRYIDIYKDIPEHAKWIENMVSKNHTLLLVGRDLGSILQSYKYPLTYWKVHSRGEVRNLWLLALTTKMFKDALGNPNTLTAMNENGDVFEIPKFSETYFGCNHQRSHCSNALCFPTQLSVSYNIPPPLPWPTCMYDRMKQRSLFALSHNHDSNIILAYLPNYGRREALFDKITSASDPYYSAIIGESVPFGLPSIIQYMNMRNCEVRVTNTVTSLHDARDLPPDREWGVEDWRAESEMDRFTVAFYRPRGIVLDDTLDHPRYEFTAIEFAGLDPDL